MPAGVLPNLSTKARTVRLVRPALLFGGAASEFAAAIAGDGMDEESAPLGCGRPSSVAQSATVLIISLF